MASSTQWTWTEQTQGVGEGQASLMCCSPRGRKESDTPERLDNNDKDCYRKAESKLPRGEDEEYFSWLLTSASNSVLNIPQIHILRRKDGKDPLSGPLNECPSVFGFFNLFIYFWLCWVFVAAHGLFSSCGQQGLHSSCSVQASHCCGFSCCEHRLRAWRLQKLQHVSAGVFGFSHFNLRALEHRLSSYHAQA